MNIVLATGIYPPEIGGPATYVRALARELSSRGHTVTVITYAKNERRTLQESEDAWNIVRVSMAGGPLVRWRKFAKALKEWGKKADVVECFSALSCGMPLRLARLKGPVKILRLGGDFPWERYTDCGGRRTLKVFTLGNAQSLVRVRAALSVPLGHLLKAMLRRVLRAFDHIVFSTQFQMELYEQAYSRVLPAHSVIENARPHIDSDPVLHTKHDPLRLLFLGRFVRFKNLDRLLRAVAGIPLCRLTIVGEGPMGPMLQTLSRTLQLQGRVTMLPPVHGDDLLRTFAEHDALILPSLTEISPNAALEARAAGLPVILSEENGLSETLREGMTIRPLLTKNDITKAILEADQDYDSLAQAAAAPFAHERGYDRLAEEHLALFHSLSRL